MHRRCTLHLHSIMFVFTHCVCTCSLCAGQTVPDNVGTAVVLGACQCSPGCGLEGGSLSFSAYRKWVKICPALHNIVTGLVMRIGHESSNSSASSESKREQQQQQQQQQGPESSNGKKADGSKPPQLQGQVRVLFVCFLSV